MRTEKPIFATIFTLLGIMLLLKLGFWQVERLSWKNDLLLSIDQEYAKDLTQHPISLDDLHEFAALPAKAAQIYRGQISGKLMSDKAPQFVVTGPHDGVPGYAVFLPLEISERLVVPVDIGWIAYNTKDEVRQKLKNLTPITLTLNVMLRALPKKYTAQPELFLYEWGYDLSQIQGKGSADITELPSPPYRALIKADAHLFLEGVTEGLSAKPVLRNKHKYYASFWLTMAFVLAVFYIMRFGSEWRAKNNKGDEPL
jgi:surfeit locus 1 family protein